MRNYHPAASNVPQDVARVFSLTQIIGELWKVQTAGKFRPQKERGETHGRSVWTCSLGLSRWAVCDGASPVGGGDSGFRAIADRDNSWNCEGRFRRVGPRCGGYGAEPGDGHITLALDRRDRRVSFGRTACGSL